MLLGSRGQERVEGGGERGRGAFRPTRTVTLPRTPPSAAPHFKKKGQVCGWRWVVVEPLPLLVATSAPKRSCITTKRSVLLFRTGFYSCYPPAPDGPGRGTRVPVSIDTFSILCISLSFYLLYESGLNRNTARLISRRAAYGGRRRFSLLTQKE